MKRKSNQLSQSTQLNLFEVDPPGGADVLHGGVDQETTNPFGLPRLPTILRYDDDFAKKYRSIRLDDNVWEFRVDGLRARLTWAGLDQPQTLLVKHYFLWAAAQYDATTLWRLASIFTRNTTRISAAAVTLARLCPLEAKALWENCPPSGPMAQN